MGERYGRVNEGNGWVPRDFWLEVWEKQAILGFIASSLNPSIEPASYPQIPRERRFFRLVIYLGNVLFARRHPQRRPSGQKGLATAGPYPLAPCEGAERLPWK